MTRLILVILFVSALPSMALTTITDTLCSGSTAQLTLTLYSSTGAQVSKTGPISYTGGGFTVSLTPTTDSGNYAGYYRAAVKCGSTTTTTKWVIPETAEVLTVVKVEMPEYVSVQNGWYWDTTDLVWASIGAGITGGGGGGGITSITISGTSNQITATGTCTGTSTISCTLSLPSGLVAPGTINGLTITTSSGTFTVANSKTLTVSNTLTLQGTDSTVITFPASSATVATLGLTNTFTGRQDATGAASTASMKTGTSLPGTCIVGDVFFKSDATAGRNIYECQSTNTWTQQVVSSGTATLDQQFNGAKCQNTISGLTSSIDTWNDGTTPTNVPLPRCVTGTNRVYGVADYADTGTRYLNDVFDLPTGSIPTITVDLGWSTSATSGSATWNLQTGCLASGATDPSWNTAQSITGTASGTANNLTTTNLASLTTTGCSAGQQIAWRLTRDTGDTLTATAALHFLRFRQ